MKKRPPRHVLEHMFRRRWHRYKLRLSEELRAKGPKVASRKLSSDRLCELLGV